MTVAEKDKRFAASREVRRRVLRVRDKEVARQLCSLKIQLRPIASLTLYPRNAHTHSIKQHQQIAKSILEFGWTVPILIDRNGRVIAGHGRIEAAKLLGIEQVPTIVLDHMTEAQKRAYLIADNKLAEKAGWDPQLLAMEFQDLSGLDLGFDLSITGFETAEIDFLIQSLDSSGASGVDDVIPPLENSAPAASRVGDLWNLLGHRLLCADATDPISFRRLFERHKAQMVFADPPYNVPIDGHVCGSGSIKHGEFPMASGEMSEIEFIAFLKTVLGNLAAFSIDGSIHFICMDWRHLFELLSAARGIFSELKGLCVWNKDVAGMGSLYRSKHELVLVLKNGSAAHVNNVELGRFGRNRTNVWNYPSANSLRQDRRDELAMHPTPKPVSMVADAILDCSKRGGIVLDCFGGSGTTLLAAQRTDRRGYLIELDTGYVDLTIRRFQKLTGEKVIHAETGMTFEEMQTERGSESAGQIDHNKRARER